MEARDTVMSDAGIKNSFNPCPKHGEPAPSFGQSVAQAQAEISFKAGEDQGYENGKVAGYNKGKQEAIESHFEELRVGRKAGIQEVVEWIWSNGMHKGNLRHYCPNCDHTIIGVTDYEWQTFLKEKGIE